MKTVALTIKLVVRVDDQTAANMIAMPLAVTIRGAELADGFDVVGFQHGHETTPYGMSLEAAELAEGQVDGFLDWAEQGAESHV